MSTYYLILTTILNMFLFCIWSKRDVYNVTLKIIFFTTSVFGMFLVLKEFGYIIKV